jgi:hypothetical protein
MTGYDTHPQATASDDEGDSREISENTSEDEDYTDALRNSNQNLWDPESETSPFEELSQTVLQCMFSLLHSVRQFSRLTCRASKFKLMVLL